MRVSEAVTHQIRVSARSFFLPERSNPDESEYLFAYRIRITNEGGVPVQLVSRHWIITDARGNIEEVKGLGVVGEQPRLEPGEEFEYTSACPLPTQYGVMRGSYQMRFDDGAGVEVAIEPFHLYVPALAN